MKTSDFFANRTISVTEVMRILDQFEQKAIEAIQTNSPEENGLNPESSENNSVNAKVVDSEQGTYQSIFDGNS